jgi:hypothetical protein
MAAGQAAHDECRDLACLMNKLVQFFLNVTFLPFSHCSSAPHSIGARRSSESESVMSELRKHRRVELSYVARVMSLEAEMICDCALVDVSQGGARIAVLAADMVPDEFLLAFSAKSDVSRRCRVVRRMDDEVGVIFLKAADSAAAMRTARRSRLLETPCP